ncbi:unnamed protein product [Pieris macdunnoughi]|uniref:MADF domain-containing protein n=1 Tax=Pieris macdunnoughi TaxID=345717 RepID=A0A821XNV4_9NEOP|nr:unnamed protein product [Pieris macdunnoughi]
MLRNMNQPRLCNGTRLAVKKVMNNDTDKCKDEWTKLRNAYVNAMKRRKNKKSGQAAIIPWKYEEQMNFLQTYIESRATVTNLESPPNSVKSDINLEESESDTIQSQLDNRSPTPQSSSSNYSRPVRNKTNLHELYDLMKSSHDLRLQKQQNKLQDKDMDETDLFFFSMSKALKKLPKLEQSKIKLDLHTAISQAEIRILEAQDQIRRMPINVTRQIISQPQQQRLQSPVHTSTSMLSFPSISTFAYTPTFTAPMEASTLDSEQQDSRLSAYYSDIQFSEEDN